MCIEEELYDYSQDFSPEELYGDDEEEKEERQYKTLEEQLSEIGMSIHDFI